MISPMSGFWRAGCIWPVLLDLYSRAVIGWAMGTHLTVELTEQALRMTLTMHGIMASMSRSGNCWHNACVESFF